MSLLKRFLARLGYVKLTDYNLSLAADGSLIAFARGPMDPSWKPLGPRQRFAHGTHNDLPQQCADETALGITPAPPPPKFRESLTSVLDDLAIPTPFRPVPALPAVPPPPADKPRFAEPQLLSTIIDDPRYG